MTTTPSSPPTKTGNDKRGGKGNGHGNEKFEGILNFRDVGKTVNEFLGKKFLKEGVLYRSARPDNASENDIRRLRDEYGIKAVMDLRTTTEHAKQTEKLLLSSSPSCASPSSSSASSPTSPSPEKKTPQIPLPIPGTSYVQTPLTGRRFELALLWHLSLPSLLWFLTLFLILRRRVQAIRLLTQQVLLPLGVQGGNNISLRVSTSEYLLSLRTFSSNIPHSPLLVHCTAGKDRTGTAVLLVLLLCKVPPEAIEHDYLVTSRSGALEPEWDERLAEMKEFGFTEDWLGTNPRFVEETMRFLEREWGGIEGYCEYLGFGPEERDRLREGLWA